MPDGDKISRKVNMFVSNNPENYKYNIPKTKDTIIVIAFFSPCNYIKPKLNLLQVINKLIRHDHPVCVIEAQFSESYKLTLPEEVIHFAMPANENNFFFLKENLYNIAAKKLDYNKFIFLDGDIIFDMPNWFDETSNLLDTNDIIQPFEYCYWMNSICEGFLKIGVSCAKALAHNKISTIGVYHPGFCWAMTRNFFEKTDGFFDEHLIGGGDTALLYSLIGAGKLQEYYHKNMINKNNLFMYTYSFIDYLKKVSDENPKVSYLKNNNAYHLYHGDLAKRKYSERYSMLPKLDNPKIYPVKKNSDGLIEWTDNRFAAILKEYFLGREEDS